MVEKSGVETSGVGKFMVEKSRVEMSFNLILHTSATLLEKADDQLKCFLKKVIKRQEKQLK